MAETKSETEKPELEQNAEKYEAPQEQAGQAFSNQAMDLFRTDAEKNKGNGPKAGDERFPLEFKALNLDQGMGVKAADALQSLLKIKGASTDGSAVVESKENFKDGNGVIRALGDRAQHVAPDGKTTSVIDAKTTVEYDPKTGVYSKVDADGKRTELKDSDKVGVDGKTLAELKQSGISERNVDGNTVRTHLDGRVVTEFKPAGPGGLSERTSFPPGYKDKDRPERAEGIRQEDIYKDESGKEKAVGRTYDDRKETTFSDPDSKVAKITAYKNPEVGKPSTVTDYKENRGPKGGQPPNETPVGASRVTTYNHGDNPGNIERVAEFRGKDDQPLKDESGKLIPDKITFKSGMTVDSPPNGDIRKPIGQGERSGVIDIDKASGMPNHMKIGSSDYAVKDGKIDNVKAEVPGPPPKTVELQRGADGKLSIVGPKDAAKPSQPGEGDGSQPAEADKGKAKVESNFTGTLNIDGMPMQFKDGKLVGDLQLNKSGDLKYKDGDGPERKETVRRADGKTETIDFKTWTKTTTDLNGQKSEQAWDGFNWRNFKASEDGKLVFDPPEANRPAYIQRTTGGDPPRDSTMIGYADGSKTDCNWQEKTQTEISKDGKTSTVRYEDGAGNYREGQVIPSDAKGPGGKPLGAADDKVIAFKDGKQPAAVARHKDGSSTAIHADGTKVDKNAAGQVSSITGKNGGWKFERDADGDISKATEIGPDGKEKNSYTRTGTEKDPGMEQWLGKEAAGKARQPSDAPPRDPNAPKDYNQFKDKDGKVINMNIHTTGDGQVKMEKPAQDGKPAEVTVQPAGGDRYKDTPTQRIYERPGDVTETVDKTQNPPTSKFEYTRNGVKKEIDTKDGSSVKVFPDGTIRHQNKEGSKADYILPSGTVERYDVKAPESPDKQPQETLSEIQLAKPNADPSKPGEFEKL
ncbi:MAG: hypothetical protein K2X27_12900, partial [Candidatus Obscuribacterales bacterium]|nr:hypothetical protein [Candidatus Obscuribacterales bacterium]